MTQELITVQDVLNNEGIPMQLGSMKFGPKEQYPFVMVRTENAGVHMGYMPFMKAHENNYEVTLLETKRIWKWAGAHSLSQLAKEGTQSPENCNFSVAVPINKMMAIEIIWCTPEAHKNLEAVPEWKYTTEVF